MTRVVSLTVVTDDDDVAERAMNHLQAEAVIMRRLGIPCSFTDADADDVPQDLEPEVDPS